MGKKIEKKALNEVSMTKLGNLDETLINHNVLG